MWGPGTLFSLTTWRKLKLCRKSIFQAPKNVFFAHAWTASNRTWNIVYPVTWWKERRRESKLRPSSVKPRQAAHYATGALLSRNFAPECLYLLWLQRAGCSMVYREALKKCFLHTNLMKLRQARLCKKNNFSGSKKTFFRMPLVKCLQYKTIKNALRIWVTLGLLWCKFACI